MIADTSDIHSFGMAQSRHADDLSAVATDLAAATVPLDAFGAIGADFLTALNDALTREASRVTALADRLAAARSTVNANAIAYRIADTNVGQSISRSGA